MSLKKVNQFIAQSIHDLDEIADYIISLIPDNKLILLQGDLGTGKTTLTQIICKKIGLNSSMSSPTYAIVNEYDMNNSSIDNLAFIYHIDLYRLNDLDEALNIGIESYLEHKRSVCFIEWPEIIISLIDRAILIKLQHNSIGIRQIDVYLYE